MSWRTRNTSRAISYLSLLIFSMIPVPSCTSACTRAHPASSSSPSCLPSVGNAWHTLCRWSITLVMIIGQRLSTISQLQTAEKAQIVDLRGIAHEKLQMASNEGRAGPGDGHFRLWEGVHDRRSVSNACAAVERRARPPGGGYGVRTSSSTCGTPRAAAAASRRARAGQRDGRPRLLKLLHARRGAGRARGRASWRVLRGRKYVSACGMPRKPHTASRRARARRAARRLEHARRCVSKGARLGGPTSC